MVTFELSQLDNYQWVYKFSYEEKSCLCSRDKHFKFVPSYNSKVHIFANYVPII